MRDLPDIPQLDLRPPAQVMRLARMGASFPTRLSFLRTLLRRLGAEGARVTRPVWQISDDGFGHAVYSVSLGGHVYSLVAVSTDLPADQRSDRVIAEAWDTAYVLYDGVPDAAEIARIVANAPLQEAGRFTERDLVLSRANKSVRLFNHVVERLRGGRQPDPDMIRKIGYLMRTTAVYGNGKFGIADRALIEDRPGLSGPFMAEMLTVWLIRGFTHDLAEHVGGAKIDRDLKRHLGIGNATGLGMAPFLVSHPVLLNNWMLVRETALARVRAVEALDEAQIMALYTLLERVASHLAEWQVPDPEHQARIEVMRGEWLTVAGHLTPELLTSARPIDAVIRWSEALSIDTQELLVAMVLEPFGDLIDGLTECMTDPFGTQLDPLMSAADLRALLDAEAAWMLDYDFDALSETAQFWYVSEEKLEPRLGDRHSEDGADLESPLDIARQVQAMAHDLADADGNVGQFLRAHPEHRCALRRVQTLKTHPYAEIRENLISKTTHPIDMLRCKLAFFGATKFDPKSTLWTRIALVQGAPLADELDAPDDWWLASLPS
ncbi:hypothetical protein [Cognatishimia sp. MH4019]|uniref:hypothetical protein n=1 Tax=Cognatishimia sp. MH4019 TaxID=2854030 RepID=UPI001CD6DA36|nr:hypothetical protein [Cognatishimia sp. MH4019]